MDLYGSLGTISMECVWSCGICVSSIVKVRTGYVISRTQNVAQGRPIGCIGGSLCNCACLELSTIVLLDTVLFGGRWALATILNCPSTQREIKRVQMLPRALITYRNVLRGKVT